MMLTSVIIGTGLILLLRRRGPARHAREARIGQESELTRWPGFLEAWCLNRSARRECGSGGSKFRFLICWPSVPALPTNAMLSPGAIAFALLKKKAQPPPPGSLDKPREVLGHALLLCGQRAKVGDVLPRADDTCDLPVSAALEATQFPSSRATCSCGPCCGLTPRGASPNACSPLRLLRFW